MNLNKVLLAGRLTRDPALKYSPKGMAICEFGVAVNRTWKSESGEKKEEVTFLDVTFFAATAEAIGQYLKKGSPIFIEGRLKLDQWDDKQTGAKRSKVGVVGESFQFVGGKEGGPTQARTAGAPKTSAAEPPPIDDDNSVPF